MLNNIMQCYAICIYLQGFGYKAKVNDHTFTTYVQDPVGDTFVVLAMPTWEAAREFIKVRSQS